MRPPENLSYKRITLFESSAFEIVSCEWTDQSISKMHTHGWSQCLVLVQEGLFENRSEFGLKSETSVLEVGQIFPTPPGVDHEIRCLSKTGKTLHVYVPKIRSHQADKKFNPGSLESLRTAMDLKLQSEPTRWTELETLLHKITEFSITTHSPYFMNQLFTGVFPETLAAEKIVAQNRTTLATFEASPAFTAVEVEVIESLCRLIGWPDGTGEGIGVPGGSAANFMAVHCARQKRVPEFRKFGSRGERFKIFTSSESHYSLKKACLATGIGTDALVEVLTDIAGRMNLTDLRHKMAGAVAAGEIPLMLCLTAGTTVLGAFDPIEEAVAICREFNVWLHVDGAWGGPALFSKQARPLLKGIEKADSMTFDAHKLFGSGLTTSFFLCAERGTLLEANDVSGGGYIFHSTEVVQDRGRMSWQCGRGAESLSFWTLWKSVGTAGLGAFVDRLFAIRDKALKFVAEEPRLQLVADPTYLNLCVRVVPPKNEASAASWSQHVREQLKADDFALVNFSRNSEGTFLRLILAHPRLEYRHVEEILRAALQVR